MKYGEALRTNTDFKEAICIFLCVSRVRLPKTDQHMQCDQTAAGLSGYLRVKILAREVFSQFGTVPE